eukprot:bmy_17146T0
MWSIQKMRVQPFDRVLYSKSPTYEPSSFELSKMRMCVCMSSHCALFPPKDFTCTLKIKETALANAYLMEATSPKAVTWLNRNWHEGSENFMGVRWDKRPHSAQELRETKTSEYFSLSHHPLDYRILLMDEDQDRIYVGSKDHILSLNINNISQEPLSVFWPASTIKVEECKMAGKDPTDQVFVIDSKCESGKGRCSFNPNVNTVSVMINEELFSGMYIDFMGTDAAIFRSLTKRNAVRTDQHNSKWLSEPMFVDAHVIPDGTDPNDAKVYFFFKEKLTDNSRSTKQIHSMVARICPSIFKHYNIPLILELICFSVIWNKANDTGGLRSLVNKWTTFLKARLVCSVTDEDGPETHFDELEREEREDVFLLETDNPRTTLVYGIFTTSSSVFKGSAVCVYHLSDIQTVFNGPFAHKEGPNHQLISYQGRIPYPRPGTCPGGAFTPNMRTTKDFPDDVVTFIRNHPLMYNSIYPVHRRPLIVRTGTDYKYTKIAVDRVNAADGRSIKQQASVLIGLTFPF